MDHLREEEPLLRGVNHGRYRVLYELLSAGLANDTFLGDLLSVITDEFISCHCGVFASQADGCWVSLRSFVFYVVLIEAEEITVGGRLCPTDIP